MGKREYTSLRIEPDLWKQVKIKAIQTDKGVSDLTEEALSTWLEILDNKEKGERVLVGILKKRLGLD